MWIICSSRCIVFHRPARSVSIAALSISSSSLPLPRRDEDRRDVGLRAAVLVEIIVDAPAEGNDPEELAAGERLAVLLGVELLDRAAKLGQVGADAGVAVDRLDRAVEEAVRGAGGFGDFLAAHRGQLVDLLAEFGAVAVERGKLVDELGDLLVELAGLLVLQRNEAGGFLHGDRLQRLGRLQLDLGRGGGRGLGRRVRWPWSIRPSLPCCGGGWTARPPRARGLSTVL